MPQFRKNPLSSEWIIFAEERSKRPDKGTSAECRFCEGMEIHTPSEVFSISTDKNREPDSPGWSLRVVPNKFPALSKDSNDLPEKEPFYDNTAGYGIHEVVINTNRHIRYLSELDEAQIKLVLDAFCQRIIEIKKDKKIKYISVFLNQGKQAGATIEHTHSQIIGLPLVPQSVKKETGFFKKYYNSNKSCYICDLIKNEIKYSNRIIYKDDLFLIAPLFFSKYFFEIDFMPLRHMSSFEDTSTEEKIILSKYIKKISGFFLENYGSDMNMFLKIKPNNIIDKDYYHWTLKIFPRINNFGGFELSTLMNINTLFPEKASKAVRQYLDGS